MRGKVPIDIRPSCPYELAVIERPTRETSRNVEFAVAAVMLMWALVKQKTPGT